MMNGHVMNKKILIIASNSIHSKRYIQGILDNSIHQVHIISNQHMHEFDNIPQAIVNFSLRNLKAKIEIRQIILKFNPAVVHIHQANSYAWHSLRALSKINPRPRVILTTWGSDVLLLPKKNILFKKKVQYNLKHSDIITSDAYFMSKTIVDLLGSVHKPIHTINFGINNISSMQEVRDKQKIILSNRLHKALYNVDKIILAFIYLVQNNLLSDDYQLIVTASGEETARLEQIVKEANLIDRIKLVGMLDYPTLVEYYKQATLFVSIPDSDSTASSLLESMSFGCIPVLSNLPANLEWVSDTENGFINLDNKLLADDMLKAVKLSQNEQQYEQLIKMNYDLIVEKALFKNNIKKFLELYR